MSNSICKAFVRRNLSVVIRSISAKTHNPCFLQFAPFSSAPKPKPTSEIANQNSFTVNYLVNSLGFSPEKASSASKYLNLKSTEQADTVIAFLNKHGFTKEQIEKLVRTHPPIVLSDPEKTLLPKIEYFRSSGISDTELVKIFMRKPSLFRRSLDRQIIPCFDYLKNLFDANGISLGYLKTDILVCSLKTQLLPNLEALKDAGVPDSKIVEFLRCFPRAVNSEPQKFRKIVGEVKEMGFDPLELRFIGAVAVLVMVKKSTWEKKVAVFQKWGISEHEVISLFEKHPRVMSYSIEKITAFMDFFVNEMRFEASVVFTGPALIGYSLDKRIKPRAKVYKILSDNGFIKRGSHGITFFQCREDVFLKNYVLCYEEKAPGLLEVYRKEIGRFKE